jgi:hypothetical protein
MRVAKLHPSKGLALSYHISFACIYLLLFARAGISFYEGNVTSPNLSQDSLPTLLLKRFSGILYQPFYGAIWFPPYDNSNIIPAIGFAILFYAFIHYGMFRNISVEEDDSMATKILAFSRAVFFLGGTLLLLLIIARMSVMLYRDVTYGRPIFGVSTKN